MASRDLNDLLPQAKTNAEKVIEVCEQVGFDLLIYCTLRSPQEQAKLYRQSRSWAEIKNKMLSLKDRGFEFIADILDEVGPCTGPHVTNAGPGESWHNYGEAWDAVPLVSGKAAWVYQGAKAEWDAYGECVRQVGMQWAGNWTTFREYPHAQLRPGGNPLKQYKPDEVLKMMQKRGLLSK